MGLRDEVVLSCFLRDDTPDGVLAALRWHLGLDADRPAGPDPEEHAYAVLRPDPDSRLPGGDVASLRRRSRGFTAEGERHAWGLFSRNLRLDDMVGDLLALLDLIAPHVDGPGHGGHVREEFAAVPAAVVFGDGTCRPPAFRVGADAAPVAGVTS
ncbi:hypothetical protein [Kitasatospora arboriphila]|uniref:hypothetical protein n=1 Tax=Kitasatospora arboriphila TaxID=258052 RepID=UPI0031D5B2A5